VRTNPPASATVQAGNTVQVLVATGTYDMFPAASSAAWSATSQYQPPSISLSFGGRERDPIGAVLAVPQAVLEDGTATQEELEAHPPQVTDDAIWGTYALPNPLLAGEVFLADIGFRHGTGGKIGYQVIEYKANGSQRVLGSGIHAAGGQLSSVSVNLTAGGTKIELFVEALDSTPAKDNAIWVDPRIEAANGPPLPARSTAPPSPSPSPAIK
jgi:hypothetical protein